MKSKADNPGSQIGKKGKSGLRRGVWDGVGKIRDQREMQADIQR